MPFNGSGVFQRVRNWVADATAGVKIRADYHDAEDDGFATGLSNTITKDGQTIITQNIPFNSKRITGLADPINPQDAATKALVDTKLNSSGTTPMTGDLLINKATPTVVLDATDLGGMNFSGKYTGKQRWLMRIGNGAAESGTNVGSDFDLHRYADDGAYLGQVLNFNRASGLATVAADPTAAMGIATKQYADNASNPRVLRAGDTMTGQLTTANSAQPINGAGGMSTLMVMGAGTHTGITFHCAGQFATNFGMATDGNFYMGGWSHSSNLYRFWTTKDFAALPTPTTDVTDGRLAFAADWGLGYTGAMQEPYAGAVVTGVLGILFQTYVVQQFRFRWMQLYKGGWYTVGAP